MNKDKDDKLETQNKLLSTLLTIKAASFFHKISYKYGVNDAYIFLFKSQLLIVQYHSTLKIHSIPVQLNRVYTEHGRLIFLLKRLSNLLN